MSYFAESFAWCMLQITIFTIVISALYLIASRWRWGGIASLPLAGLCIVGVLTLFCAFPWPSWSSLGVGANPRTKVADKDVRSRAARAKSNRASKMESPAPAARMTEPATRPISDRPVALDPPAATSMSSPKVEAASPRTELAVRWWVVAVFAAWAAAAIGVCRFLVALAGLRRLIRTSSGLNDPSLLQSLAELSAHLELHRVVRLREASILDVAATCGWRRPVILLPVGWRQWKPDERRAVLAHELAHIRQGHFPKWLCGQLAVVAHFYHPLMHWLARRLRFEQEVAADVLAARVFGDCRCYAGALAALALGSTQSPAAVPSLGLLMARPFLMRRLVVLRQRSNSTQDCSWVTRIFVLLFVTVAAMGAAGVRAGQTADDETPAAASSKAARDPAQADQGSAQPPASTEEALAQHCYVTALFRVSREPDRVLGGSSTESDASWEIFCKTQIALLESHFVLQAAVSDPGVAKLLAEEPVDDPVGMLARVLEVGFYPGSEILYLRISSLRANADQIVVLVNAVAKAYQEEVVNADRQRQLATRDLLANSLTKLKSEISHKSQELADIAREAGVVDSGPGQVAQQLDLRRLERVEEEIMRLENDFLELQTSDSKTGNPKFYEQRIEQLSKRQEELENRIMRRSESSVELVERRRELDQLQRVASDMAMKLELMDVEANAPSRIEQIQAAVVTDTEPTRRVKAAK